jgi:hypothetical protein
VAESDFTELATAETNYRIIFKHFKIRLHFRKQLLMNIQPFSLMIERKRLTSQTSFVQWTIYIHLTTYNAWSYLTTYKGSSYIYICLFALFQPLDTTF